MKEILPPIMICNMWVFVFVGKFEIIPYICDG